MSSSSTALPVSIPQLTSAITALCEHASKKQAAAQENELLPGREQNVLLVVALKRIVQNGKGKSFKPVKIAIPHPIISLSSSTYPPIILIVKDPQREYKDLLEEHSIPYISRVIGITKLRGKFKSYEARRMLLKEAGPDGLFLADERVVPLLPALLGTKFFAAKKQPVPVCLTRKDLKAELERAIQATYLFRSKGTCVTVKVATLEHNTAQIAENIITALPSIVSHLSSKPATAAADSDDTDSPADDGWSNIQALSIKTNDSVSLPVWTCALDDSATGRFNVNGDGLLESSANEDEDDDDDAEKMAVDVQVVEAPKSKKRKADEDKADSVPAPQTKKSAKGASAPQTEAPVVAPTPVAVRKKNAKKTKDVAVVEQIATPVATVVVEETSTLPPKKKARKSKTAELDVPVVVVASPVEQVDVAMDVVVPTTEPIVKKKARKSKGAIVEVPVVLSEAVVETPTPMDVVVEAPVAGKKKPRKSKTTVEAPIVPEPVVVAQEVVVDEPSTILAEPEVPIVKKKKPRKSKGSDVPEVVAEVVSVVPEPESAIEPTPKKKRGRKSKGAEEEDPVIVVVDDDAGAEAQAPVPTADESTPKKKPNKKEKARFAVAAAASASPSTNSVPVGAAPASLSVSEPVVEKPVKAKKGRKSATGTEPVPEEPVVVDEPAQEQPKKKKARKNVVEEIANVPAVEVDIAADTPKKAKKSRKSVGGAPEPSVSDVVATAEPDSAKPKQKKEKKAKDGETPRKMGNEKGGSGKRAKDAVLGRKAGPPRD